MEMLCLPVSRVDEPRVKRARQRAIRAGYRGPHFTRSEWWELVERQGDACACCGAVGGLTVDHVVPLSMGGSNAITNIQGLCDGCNGRKGDQATDYRAGSFGPWPFSCASRGRGPYR